jgi:hypothetical protein
MPAKELSEILHVKIAQLITAVIACSLWPNQSLQRNAGAGLVISDETAPYPRKSSFLAAPAPKSDFGRD